MQYYLARLLKLPQERYAMVNLYFRETNGGQMSLVFECNGSGLKNMDMDLIQYMIRCFEEYFPYCLNYILVIEMSWVLNGKYRHVKLIKRYVTILNILHTLSSYLINTNIF